MNYELEMMNYELRKNRWETLMVLIQSLLVEKKY